MPDLKRIDGVHLPLREASGLAYHPDRKTLFIGDDSGRAYEVTLGDSPSLRREVPLDEGLDHDLEGIAVGPGGALWIAAERTRRILVYDVDGKLEGKHDLDFEGKKDNAGLEGLTFDPGSGRTFAVHERKPKRLLELSRSFEVARVQKIKGLKDLAGVCAHEDALWIVSDDSAEVVRYEERDGEWNETGAWSLERKSGEGLAIVGDRLYVAYDQAEADEDNLVWYVLPGTEAKSQD